MLTFSSFDGGALRLSGGGVVLRIFPSDQERPSGSLSLLSAPEEQPSPSAVSWPGEYNEQGVSIRGIGHQEGRQVSYVVEADGVRSAFLSSPLQDWKDSELEQASDIDVLALSVGEVKLVQKLVDEFDPRVLLLCPNSEKGEEYGAVLKAIGGTGAVVSEYKLKTLPAEGREVVVLA